jgi:hypothetical protein
MVQVQDSISERLHHHTFSNMLFNMISKAHHVRIFSCFGPRVDTWFTTRPIFPTFWLSSLVFFHSTSYATWITPSLNCRHPLMCVHTSHWPYEYPPPTLCSWQRMHWNLWCNSWHLCRHCKRCWFPRGMITITCVSFNHIQLVLLTNQHHVYQKWHLHPRLNYFLTSIASKYTSHHYGQSITSRQFFTYKYGQPTTSGWL